MTVPDDDTTHGVLDHFATAPPPGHFTAFLHVQRRLPERGWQWSPSFPMSFRAKRDVKLLSSDPVVKLELPGGNYGSAGFCGLPFQAACASTYTTLTLDDGLRLVTNTVTFYCDRQNPAGPCGDIYGTDFHRIGPLNNDWVLDSFVFESNRCDDTGSCGELDITGPDPPFPPGSPDWSFSVSWWVTQNDTAWYRGDVYITGPVDVPW